MSSWDTPTRKTPPLTFAHDQTARDLIGSATAALVHSFSHLGETDPAPLPSPPIPNLESWLGAFDPAPSLDEEERDRIRETAQALEQEVWLPEDIWGGAQEEQDRVDVNLEAGTWYSIWAAGS